MEKSAHQWPGTIIFYIVKQKVLLKDLNIVTRFVSQPCLGSEEFDLQWWSRCEGGSSGKRKLDDSDPS